MPSTINMYSKEKEDKSNNQSKLQPLLLFLKTLMEEILISSKKRNYNPKSPLKSLKRLLVIQQDINKKILYYMKNKDK